MRKRLRVLVLAAIVITIVVPVGFALTLRPEPLMTRARIGGSPAALSFEMPAAVLITTGSGGTVLEHVPDAARLFFLGAILLGLAAVVRKGV
jgi:hypothetical protein